MESETIVDLFAAITKIDTARSADAILQAFRAAMEHYGLRNFLITGLPVPHGTDWQREILADGWSPEWHRRYVAQEYFLHDPCVAQCRHSPEPFRWGELPAARLVAR